MSWLQTGKADCRWDVVALGEVLLRLDPGERRIAQARSFDVWEGGGEYNVARAAASCFRQRALIVTSLVRNPIGTLLESLIGAGGVDASEIVWRDDDGMGREARNGLYFLERGFGVRGALAAMDRGHTAVSQLQPGELDWDRIFSQGARWFHTGGIFCGLSESTPAVAREAMEAARRHGATVSYDCNYRPSLWRSRGGRAQAARVNRELVGLVDVLFGHEGDLALELGESSDRLPEHTRESYAAMAARLTHEHPNLKVIATSTRRVLSASRNSFGGFAYAQGELASAEMFEDLEVLDRVGSGDAFAAGLVCGLLSGHDVAWSLRCGVAHGALAMTTAGDSSFATEAEVRRLMGGGGAGVER